MELFEGTSKDELMEFYEFFCTNKDVPNFFYKYRDEIQKVVVTMFTIDEEIAAHIWGGLINVYEKQLTSNESYYLCEKIANDVEEIIGKDNLRKLILEDLALKKGIFSVSKNDSVAIDIIYYYTEKIELNTADDLLMLLFENKNRRSSWYKIINYLLPEHYLSDCEFEFWDKWCNKAKSIEERAALNVQILERVNVEQD